MLGLTFKEKLDLYEKEVMVNTIFNSVVVVLIYSFVMRRYITSIFSLFIVGVGITLIEAYILNNRSKERELDYEFNYVIFNNKIYQTKGILGEERMLKYKEVISKTQTIMSVAVLTIGMIFFTAISLVRAENVPYKKQVVTVLLATIPFLLILYMAYYVYMNRLYKMRAGNIVYHAHLDNLEDGDQVRYIKDMLNKIDNKYMVSLPKWLMLNKKDKLELLTYRETLKTIIQPYNTKGTYFIEYEILDILISENSQGREIIAELGEGQSFDILKAVKERYDDYHVKKIMDFVGIEEADLNLDVNNKNNNKNNKESQETSIKEFDLEDIDKGFKDNKDE